ncbi:HipA domain-containing protein [Halomonas sp. ISL-60]|uniref:HipA domain-containing protein n=1 Tax=Halomonas sp. ISL-56 TaxID=2819149 RepID=UPI001BE93D50|nr:HipA domain-containing protein [Halomonas sp. ISL-56]MBT2773226.1 HipA domain-containing protein [Halomonas sp. ISL-60]MBT2799727.1 HipA domain-containing protein [Halomonas sp. ISL-56]
MSYRRCLATLAPLAANEMELGYRKTALKKLFGTTDIKLPLTFSRREFFTKSAQYTRGLSISGVQQKLSLRLNPETRELEPTAEGGEFILKPSPEEYPHAAENEHAAMLASERIGIETANRTLVAFKDGELAYLTRRFDRQADGSKIHQEDVMQISGMPPAGKYALSYELAGTQIDAATFGKMAVKLDLFKRVLFSYVIGNDDLHMKNLSLQRVDDAPGGYFDKLTPSYDVLFVQAFEASKNGQFLACDLLTDPESGEEAFTEHYAHYGFYTGYDFLELGRRYGLRAATVIKAIRDQVKKQDEILDVIASSYMPEVMKQEAASLVKGRTRAISTGVDR